MGFDSEDDISDTETDVERATAVSFITIPSLIYLNTFSRLLCWTAQIIFPYLRTSFLTDFKTGWIACLKDQLIGLFLQHQHRILPKLYRYHVNYWPEFPISPSTWNSK